MKTKKVLSAVLSLAMMCSALPLSAFAEDTLLTSGAVTEQFNLPLGGTYYFDLSGEAGTITDGESDNIGTINTALPDETLHYVPFTYTGTIKAYTLKSASSGVKTASDAASMTTDPSAQYGYTYDHSLFVADYNVSHTVSWNMLNTSSLIFGKTYDTNYTLRSLSVGSDVDDPDSNRGGTPTKNEWDAILGKTELVEPIKNVVSGLYSLGQDTYANPYANSHEDNHIAMRGGTSTDHWRHNMASGKFNQYGFRPALEVLNPTTLATNGLKAITLNLNGGSFNSENSINIVSAGDSYTAPPAEGLTRPTDNTDTYFAWNTQADGSGIIYAPGASVPNTVTTLYAMWIEEQQFNLPLGGTYYFDLSSEAGNIGTINTALPDDTLHYVPFTYAGTVNSYNLTNASSGDKYASTNASATPTYRSLFVADYNVSHTVSWNKLSGLNDNGIGTMPAENLIFGKPYDTNYTLRSLSAGSDTNTPNPGGDPTNNEWDVILGKNAGYIQNWSGIFSWGQDTYRDDSRAARGSSSASAWINTYSFNFRPDLGFRPALEVLNPTTLGIDGLRAISLNLNGGSFNSENSINIVSAGNSYTAPPAESLTRPATNTGTYFAWNTQADCEGTIYAPGASVPNTVTTLYAMWIAPIYGMSLTPSTDYTFPAVAVGYGEQNAYGVSVSNTGNTPTGDLTVALSGTDKDDFTLDKTVLASIATGADAVTFTVKPNVGLAAGTHTATITVSGSNNMTQSFDVSFTVTTSTSTELLPYKPNGTVDLENSTKPSGNTLHITPQSEAEQQKDLNILRDYAQQNGITGEVHFLADITMKDENNNVVQPQGNNTRIRIIVPGLTTADTVTVLHIKEDDNGITVEEIRPVDVYNGYVEFYPTSFSVYSVIVHKASTVATTTPLSPQTGVHHRLLP